MLAFEDPNFIIEYLDLLINVLMDAFCFFRVIEVSLTIALLNLFNYFGLVLLKHVLNFNVDFLFAFC